MKNFKNKIVALFLVLACLVLMGCDPGEEQLKKGENIDIGGLRGKVLEMGVRYFLGDNPYTKEMKGQPYYWVRISYVDAAGTEIDEVFLGVLPGVHDVLKPGMELPTSSSLSLLDLTKIEGEVVDMYRNLDTDRFWIVVLNLDGLNKYRVDMKAFYTIKDSERKLPLNSDSITGK